MSTLAAIQLRDAMAALSCAMSQLESARAQVSDPIAALHVTLAITDAGNAQTRIECAIRGMQQRADLA